MVFSQVDGACLKILREWRVIDWCQFDKNAPDECYPANIGRFCYTQVIKVHDEEGPEFTSDCDDQTICIDGPNCTGVITQEATAFDKCTPSNLLIWTYMIDLDNDGTFDVSGNRSSFTRTLEAGTYRVKFTVEDLCGNANTCEYELVVEDCKKPTPYCKNGVTTVVMPSSGDVTIWANDFDAGSFDNCTDTSDLRFSFSTDVNETGRTFSCADIENGVSDTIEVTIYVWDEEGNSDFCQTVLILQDNQDVCPNTGNAQGMISGLVADKNAERMKDVEVVLESPSMTSTKTYMTDEEGYFAFPDVAMYEEYHVSAKHNKDPMNGVSTLDLVLIQRHLLGRETFESPYQYIAADVNNSEGISAGDISELRKMILGVYAEFQKNESWRFVDQDHQFADVHHPFPFDEEIDFMSFSQDEMASDFVAVKIGDVSGDAEPSGLTGNKTRGGQMVLSFENSGVNGSNELIVPIKVASIEMSECLALQFTVEYDQSLLELVDLRSGALSITDDNVANLGEGKTTFSWGDIEAVELNEGDLIATAVFEVTSTLDGKSPAVITSSITEALAYDKAYNAYDVSSRSTTTDSRFVLHQNTPNPFRGSTTIAFELPQSVDYNIEIFDMSGKVLKRVDGFGQAGYQSIELDLSQFSESSVLYYQLNTEEYSATKKMVIIE